MHQNLFQKYKKKILRSETLVIALIILYIAILFHTQIKMLYGLHFLDFDISNRLQGLYLLSEFQEPFMTTRGLNMFGDHTSFINIIFVPFFWLMNAPVHILLLTQTIVLGASGYLIYLIAKKQLHSKPIAIIITLLYLLYPALHYLNLENYHEDIFIVPVVLLIWLGFLHKNNTLILISTIISFFIKEHMPLAVFGITAYLFLVKRYKPVKYIPAVALIVTLLLSFVISPLLAQTQSNHNIPRLLHQTSSKNILQSTSDLHKNMLTNKNLEYIGQLFAPLGFIPLLSPGALLFSPQFYGNLLVKWSYAHSIKYHYTAPIIPVLFIAFIQALNKIKNKKIHIRKKQITILPYIVSCILIISLLSINSFGHQHISTNALKENLPPKQTTTLNEIHQAKQIINQDAVSVSYKVLPFFTSRKEIFMFPNPLRNKYYGPTYTETYPIKPKYIFLFKEELTNDIVLLLEQNNYIPTQEFETTVLFKQTA